MKALFVLSSLLTLWVASRISRASDAYLFVGTMAGVAALVMLLLRVSASHQAKLDAAAARQQPQPPRKTPPPVPAPPSRFNQVIASTTAPTSPEEPVPVAASSYQSSYRLPPQEPASPRTEWQARWIATPEQHACSGREINLSLCYVGNTPLRRANEPATSWIIDLRLPVDWQGGPYPPLEHWTAPVYADLSPAHRGAYLRWLDRSRSDCEMPSGYVLLFLAGLEVRLTCGREAVSTREAQQMLDEIWRLRRGRAEQSWQLERHFERMCLLILGLHCEVQPHGFDMFRPRWGYPESLPDGLAVLIGREMERGRPIPEGLALEWVRAQRASAFRTASERCRSEFQALFSRRYRERYPEGVPFATPKGKLRLAYIDHADDTRECSIATDLPDPGRLSAPVEKLAEVVDQVQDELDAYSRYLGRTEGSAGKESLEAALLLPTVIRPSAFNTKVTALQDRVGQGMVVLHTDELLAGLGALAGERLTTRTQWERLTAALREAGLGIEWAAKGPPTAAASGDDRLALYALDAPTAGSSIDASTVERPAFEEASIALDLAMLMLQSDQAEDRPGAEARQTGEPTTSSHAHMLAGLSRAVQLLDQVSSNDRRRLIARLRLRYAKTVTLASLKRPIAALPPGATTRLCAFLVRAAQEDGVVSPAEIRSLQKIYRALGRPPEQVYQDVHHAPVGTAGPSAATVAPPSGPTSPAFALDPAKLAALEAETHAVQAMLAGIFADDDAGGEAAAPRATPPATEQRPTDQAQPAHGPAQPPVSTLAVGATVPTVATVPSGRTQTTQPLVLPGLDAAHDELARTMLAAPSHARADLRTIATRLALMLDGALEVINEAAYDQWDTPFCEGEDPVELTEEAQSLAAGTHLTPGSLPYDATATAHESTRRREHADDPSP